MSVTRHQDADFHMSGHIVQSINPCDKWMTTTPWLYLVPKKSDRILLIGVAGGTVIDIYDRLYPGNKTSWVFVDINAGSEKTIESEGSEFIKSYQGAPFDSIIIDAFSGEACDERFLTSDFSRDLLKICTSFCINVAHNQEQSLCVFLENWVQVSSTKVCGNIITHWSKKCL